MTREELIQMPEYWIGQMQLALYEAAEQFMKEHHMNRTQLAAYLGVSKGYVSQLLNGDYNYSLSKLVELAIKLNCVPKLHLEPMRPRRERKHPKFEAVESPYTARYNNRVTPVTAATVLT